MVPLAGTLGMGGVANRNFPERGYFLCSELLIFTVDNPQFSIELQQVVIVNESGINEILVSLPDNAYTN